MYGAKPKVLQPLLIFTGPQFACPRIDILEKEAVNVVEIFQTESAESWTKQKLSAPEENSVGFK